VPDFARPRFTSNDQERKIADAVAAAPDLYTVIEENDRVRIPHIDVCGRHRIKI
jgi:hypothetical protein